MKKPVFLLFLLLLLPAAYAEQGHMRLLAVSDTLQGQVGGIADLYIETKPGTGRVFLETFPLTRIDTQISTRLAKEIACDFAEVDCKNIDFFYTITADSSIIAGPSAGAAIAVLTFSVLKGVEIDERTAITGTINSGGLIGPVGGLKAKIDAAEKNGFTKVLIPIGESLDGSSEDLNLTFDLEALRKESSVKIVEIPTLDEAVFEFTGKRFRERKDDIEISGEYSGTMRTLATELCSRSSMLMQSLAEKTGNLPVESAINLSVRGNAAFEKGMYYSSASYCFGSNVESSYAMLLEENPDAAEVIEKVREMKDEVSSFEEEIRGRKISTITQLESYMVVRERLTEADDLLRIVLNTLNDTNSSLRSLAYAGERLNSARAWSEFMGTDGKKFNLDADSIKAACRTKIAEVEERLQYVQLILPSSLEGAGKDLEYAYDSLENRNYELCLFRASKAKADVDTVLSVFGVRTANVKEVVGHKLDIVQRNLVEEIGKGIFPILGYSYYEYAISLKDDDPFSALLYAGYALELSDLDIYLDEGIPITSRYPSVDRKLILVLVLGILLGMVASGIYHRSRNTGIRSNPGKARVSKAPPGKKR